MLNFSYVASGLEKPLLAGYWLSAQEPLTTESLNSEMVGSSPEQLVLS